MWRSGADFEGAAAYQVFSVDVSSVLNFETAVRGSFGVRGATQLGSCCLYM